MLLAHSVRGRAGTEDDEGQEGGSIVRPSANDFTASALKTKSINPDVIAPSPTTSDRFRKYGVSRKMRNGETCGALDGSTAARGRGGGRMSSVAHRQMQFILARSGSTVAPVKSADAPHAANAESVVDLKGGTATGSISVPCP